MLLQILEYEGFPGQYSPPLVGRGESHCLNLSVIPPPQISEQLLPSLQAPQDPETGAREIFVIHLTNVQPQYLVSLSSSDRRVENVWWRSLTPLSSSPTQRTPPCSPCRPPWPSPLTSSQPGNITWEHVGRLDLDMASGDDRLAGLMLLSEAALHIAAQRKKSQKASHGRLACMLKYRSEVMAISKKFPATSVKLLN